MIEVATIRLTRGLLFLNQRICTALVTKHMNMHKNVFIGGLPQFRQ